MRTLFDAPRLARAIADVTGVSVTRIESIVGGGYSPAKRLVVTLTNDTSVFVKWATEPLTAGWIAKERDVYTHFGSADFAPRYFGGGAAPDAAGEPQPFLVLEDLSDCHWPPPWSPARVQAVRDALDQVHATRGTWMDGLPGADQETKSNGWSEVAANPMPFLSLGVCSASWLNETIPALQQAAVAAPFFGDDLLHIDIRSDNLCFRADGRACIVDWNWVCRGNPDFDLACWLPSLHAEGGPLPEEVLPDAPGFAAWLAGYFAAHAGLPPHPLAPRVRAVQKRQLESALPWAVRALGLPPLV